METIDIKCPKCGKVLRVQNQPGIERMMVPCPVCGERTPFSKCSRVQKQQSSNDTELPSHSRSLRAVLVDKCTLRSYELPVGRNTVGRAHPTSSASVQIATEDQSISRVHSIIEVVKTTAGNLRCIISNAKNKNGTYINGEKLDFDDEICLNDGDIIKMSRSEFRLEITEN